MTEVEQLRAEEAARLASPEAVRAREESSAAYESYGSAEAQVLIDRLFSGLVQEPDGGPPKLPEGERIVGFPSDFTATLSLPEGKHGVLDSLQPIAVQSSAGRVPINVMPRQSGSAFEASTPAEGMHVRVGGRLSEGASLSDVGVTMVPVSQNGAPLEASGVVDGASVFYGNSEASQKDVLDVDSLIKIGTGRVSEETVLRSERSPQKLYFKIGLPAGASLEANKQGDVQVVDAAGQPIAQIGASSGRDAEGTVVPLSVSVSGDVIALSVEHRPGQYRMPVMVDPTLSDTTLAMPGNWAYKLSGTAFESVVFDGPGGTVEGLGVQTAETTPYSTGQYGLIEYPTQNESRIYAFVANTASGWTYTGGIGEYTNLLGELVIEKNRVIENLGGKPVFLPANGEAKNTLCVKELCNTPSVSEGQANAAVMQLYAEGSGESKKGIELKASSAVDIVQEKSPTVSIDTADAYFGSAPNGAYLGNWENSKGASVGLLANDPGVGVSEYSIASPQASGWGHAFSQLSGCAGAQCNECWNYASKCESGHSTSGEPITYSMSGLPEGEDTVEAKVEDAALLTGSITGTVKIDNLAPHNIVLSGLPASKEIGAGEYKLKVEATDGEGTTRSSGVKSIKMLIDGQELGTPTGSCSLGPCTAHRETTIFGREYATGRHTITLIVADNAGNTAIETVPMIVHPASPVALGPGGFNPQSGELVLRATDVSMGGGLTLSRSYDSRQLAVGSEGPIGPQWGLSLGGEETLIKQADGSMVLTDASGSQTIFSSNGKGGYISPAGDTNLTLSENVTGGIKEFALKNAADATSTSFQVPSSGNGKVWTPAIARGPVATDTVTYAFHTVEHHQEYPLPAGSEPYNIAKGPDGNLWFTNEASGKIGKISAAGAVTEYTAPSGPWLTGITEGSDKNLWFVNANKDTIGKITTSGSITEYTLASGNVVGIAAGPDGNLWFTATSGKIGKVTTSGVVTEYTLPPESEPRRIVAGPDGNLWFTNGYCGFTSPGRCAIGKITTTGVVTEYNLSSSVPLGITKGPDGNLWFTGSYGSAAQVGKITTSGTVTLYGLPSKSEPQEITTGPDGNLWLAEQGTNMIGRITTAGALTEFPLVLKSSPHGIAPGPDGNLWFTDKGTNKIGMITTAGVTETAITEPTEALAPVPAGVSCSPSLKQGCRALTFNYAESTTAAGEARSEWGDYSGQLTRAYYTAYDPSSKAMKTVEVAHYLYDKQGRLRTVWDPRITPELKTSYGYDPEGHVTSLTAPGQESWTFTYGTIKGDLSAGRLLKVDQASVTTALWAGENVKNSEAPKLSGSAVVGVRMAVSNGTWTGSPVSYSYQWDDCNSSGKECTAIAGATNPNYTPASSDLGHTLIAQVTAINGGGSMVVSSAASATVASTGSGALPSYTQTIDSPNSVNAVSCIPATTECVASDSTGKALYASNVSTKAAATWTTWSGPGTSPSEAVDCPSSTLCLMAAGSDSGNGGNLYYATSLGGAWTQAYSPVYGVDAISCPSAAFCMDGQDGFGYFRYSTSPASTTWNLESQGEAPMLGVFCLSSSFCAIADGAGSVHVATTTSQVESSSWTVTNVDGTSALNGVACTSTSSCVAVDGAGNVLNLAVTGTGAVTATKHNIDGLNSLTAITCTGTICVAVDSPGNIFVSGNGGESWTKQLTPGGKLTSVSCASGSLCVTADTSGKVTAFNPTNTQTIDGSNSLNAVSCIAATSDCVVSDSLGNALYATNVTASAAASWNSWNGPGASPSEAVDCPSSTLCLMAAGSDNGYGGNLYYATSLGGAWTMAYSPANGVDTISCSSTSFCIDGQDAYGYFRYATSPASTSWTLEDQGSADMNGAFCLSSSFCTIADGAGNVHAATTVSQVESSAWTETNVDGTTALNGIACTSTTSCVAVDGAGNVLNLTIASNGGVSWNNLDKHNIDSTNSLTAVTCTSTTCVTVDNHGNIFVSTDSGSSWTKLYALGVDLTSVSCSSTLLCVAADTIGGVSAFNLTGTVTEGEVRSAQPGFTIEYGVPLSGSGLPTMTSGEVEKWGQKDLPTEATAVFAPDEPQGWPASGYKRATIYYRDSTDRTVNVEAPGGAISTSEYNETNDVVRSLSPDNRATALKEGAKSAETAKLLDTQSTYNGEGTELLSTLGPRHTIKLANSKEVLARNHTLYSYDEGAPLGGPYRLVTKVTQGAQIEGEPEQDIRTTVTSYSGQNNLGWILRKPTSVTTDPSGLKLIRTTVYDSATGNVIETRSPKAGSATEVHSSGYITAWGSFGASSGLPVNMPQGIAADSKGDIWVADTGNSRIQELSPTGESIAAFGTEGTGSKQFKKPAAVAIDKEGNIWVADTGNSRVQELSAAGTFIRTWGTTSGMQGIAVDSKGNVWVTAESYVWEYSSIGGLLNFFGGEGTGGGKFKQPSGIAVDSTGNVWVADTGNNRVQKLSSTGGYLAQYPAEKARGLLIDSSGNLWLTLTASVQEMSSSGTMLKTLGSEGTGDGQLMTPYGLALDPSGNVWVADTLNNRIQELSSTGAYIRQYPGGALKFDKPMGVAVDPTGNVWIADTENHRVQEASSSGTFLFQFAGSLVKPEGIAADSAGNLWVTDASTSKINEFSSNGGLIRSFGAAGIENGQFKEPAGIGVYGEAVYVVDRGNNRVEQFNIKGEYVRQFGTTGTGNGQLSKPQGITVDSFGNVWVADTGNNRIQEFTPEGVYEATYGALGTGNGQFSKPEGLDFDTEGNVWVADTGNNRVQELSSTGVYIQKFGSAGSGTEQFSTPVGLGINSQNHIYVLDTGNGRVQEWAPSHGSADNGGVHGTQTIYYTNEANSTYPACGGHPEWANMPCQTQPAAQPNTPGIPNLPVTTIAYNMYGEPTETKSTVSECDKVAAGTGKYTNSACAASGAGEYETKTSTRTNIVTYDEAGRPLTSETATTVGEALPKVTDKYNPTMGMLVEQTTSTQSLKGTFNTLGQLTSYTDADGNTTSYEYEGEKSYQGAKEKDSRLRHMDDGKGIQSYSYDPTTGLPTELADSAVGILTASYDIEGNLTSESYPNGMSANITRNQIGQPTSIQYVKNTSCAGTCPETWYTDTVAPSIHGQWITQQSSLAAQSYTYDQAGRLTQVLDNVAGKGCVTRIYAYDEETNRLSVTTRPPGSGETCTTEGGTVESHTYDSANRLTDPGTTYDPFGNTTALPATDAGGYPLTSTFFADNQLHTQEQNKQTLGYQLDPEDRTREIVSTGNITATEIQHYPGPGSSTPSWTGELSTNYTRYITGISGMLAAIQHNGETPVLQLANLHGDIIATATDTPTATSLASTIGEASEYGVPATEAPSKHSWLGVHEIPTTLPSGVTAMGVRSYIPQLGRFLQEDPIPGGSANAYAYTYGDPVNTFDLTGAYTAEASAWVGEGARQIKDEERLAREQAAREEAERKAAEAAAQAALYAAFEEEGPEEEWSEEEEYEEWGEEYAAFGPGPGAGKLDVHLEDGVLYQVFEREAEVQQVPRGLSNLAELCRNELKVSKESKPHGACARYADILGIGKAVSKAAKWVWKAAKDVYKSTLRKVNTVVKAVRYGYNCGKAIGSHERGYGGCDPLTFIGIKAEPAY